MKDTKIPLFRRWVLQNFPFIEQDFDALTDYQLICKVVEYLNKCIETVNTSTEQIEVLTNAFNQLKDYVDHYFDNIDVQEEINNKLDAMVEDGTLQEIIASYIQSQVAWTFDTVADMKNSNNLINGSYAQTLGFHNVNDGGGALYKITNSGTANEMDVIAVGDLYAHLTDYQVITPEQFGAYGDGTHDDAPNIRCALSYINSKNGGTLLLNTKTYLINSVANPDETVTRFFNIPNNLTMIGKGTIKVADNFGDYDCIFVYVSALDNITFKDFTIDDNTTNNPVLNTTGGTEGHNRTAFRLIAYATKNITIDNITFDDCAGVWQIIMEKVINGRITNVTINYSTDVNINYDRTSIYFGALYGEINNCTLYGNGKGGTAFELHGNDNIFTNNYVEDYGGGIFITNQNIVNEDIKRLEVCSNTLIIRRRAIECWLDSDDKNIDLISIHDNLVEITDQNSSGDILGIGGYTIFGNNSTVKDCLIYNNTIKTNNTNAYPIRFEYDASANTFTMNNLRISDNIISGVMKQGIHIESQTNNTLKILTTIIENNNCNVSNATTLIVLNARQGFDYMYIRNNIVQSSSITSLYKIFGTPTCESYVENNSCSSALVANSIVAGDDVSGVKLVHKNVTLNTNTIYNALPNNILDGSIIQSNKFTCYKDNGKWLIKCSSQNIPKHQWIGKGSVINLTNDSDIMAIAKKAGYLPDHKMDTGSHHVGDWVQYGSYVWYCKADNTYTDNPESHSDSFQYIGDLCTFYTISAT